MSAEMLRRAASAIREDGTRFGPDDPFMLAVADWLEVTARRQEAVGWWQSSHTDAALAVARAYLRGGA